MTQKTSIAPMLSVRNGAKAVEFYKAAFGAGELFRIDSDDGAVVARLSVGGRILGRRRVSGTLELQPRGSAAVRCAW
jgi:hypothetical protein